ncbi:MAG: hypothetical protein AAGB32_04170 [Pseudomonadota bacterium]
MPLDKSIDTQKGTHIEGWGFLPSVDDLFPPGSRLRYEAALRGLTLTQTWSDIKEQANAAWVGTKDFCDNWEHATPPGESFGLFNKWSSQPKDDEYDIVERLTTIPQAGRKIAPT